MRLFVLMGNRVDFADVLGQTPCSQIPTNEFGADLALSADVRPTQGLGWGYPISSITNARPGHPD